MTQQDEEKCRELCNQAINENDPNKLLRTCLRLNHIMEKKQKVAPVRRLEPPEYRAMSPKYCPNGECVTFQCEVETGIARCRLCGWEMQLVNEQSDSVKEDTPNRNAA